MLLEQIKHKQLMLELRRNRTFVGCNKVKVKDVWTYGVPKLLTESAFRLLDVNEDGVLDIIFGFATGEGLFVLHSYVCMYN